MKSKFTFLWSFIALFCMTAGQLMAVTSSSITQYGITWTFDQAYETGQFANGDYWVVGPIVITSISPTPSGGRNGSMVNPMPMSKQAYDDKIGKYDASYLFTGGTVGINSSVVSSISLPDSEAGSGRNILQTAAVLTVLGSVPPNNGANVFRPPYLGTSKPFYYTDDMDPGKLQTLPLISAAPAATTLPGRYKRVQLDHITVTDTRGMLPADNMQTYGAANCRDYGELYLMLSLDYPLQYKIPLLINVVQIGIDYYHAMLLGQKWMTNGGHSSGHKMTVLFAGHILNNANMLNVMQWYTGNFAEDCQTFYTTENPPTEWGTGLYEQLDPSYGPNFARYGQRHCTNPTNPLYHGEIQRGGGSPYETYWFINSPSWVGQTLAARLYGLEGAWAHDAYFDHEDRFIETKGFTGSWQSGFSNQMWSTYRHNYTLVNPTVVATPTINPAGGTFTGSATVDISTSTSGATIYYTDNGSTPTQSSTLYTQPFTITSSKTIKARAYKSGLTESAVKTESFTIQVDNTAPAISSVGNSTTPNLVTVVFDEDVTSASAQNASNYSIDNGISISSATLQADQKTVSLAVSTLSESTTYTLTVNNVQDLSSNTIAANSTATFQYINGQTSTANWQTFASSTQTNTFIAEFDVIPNVSNMDGVVGILNGTATQYDDLACIIRFNSGGYFDARDGGSYIKDNTINYTAGNSYHCRMDIDIPNHTYDIYVTPQGGSETTLGTGYAFRTAQASVSSLDGWSIIALSGSHTVSNVTFNASGTIPVTSVSVSPTSLNLNVGGTSDLTETVLPANATNQSVTWSSSNTSIATVDANGVVSTLSAGQATITATSVDGGYSATCDVTVNSGTQVVTLNPIADSYVRGSSTYENNNYGTDVDLTVKNGSEAYTRRVYMKFDLSGISSSVSSAVLRLYLNNANGSSVHSVKLVSDDSWTETGITWLNEPSAGSVVASNNVSTSDVGSYIDYDIQTAVEAESGGLLSLQITAENYSYTSYDSREATNKPELVITPLITQVAVTGVAVSPTSLTLDEGQTSDLTETISPANASDQAVSWSSSNTSVATVNASGLVTAVSAGNAVITVTTNDGGYTATCNVTVNVPVVSVTGVSVLPTSITLDEGQTSSLTETVSPANATDQSVSWSSSNSSIATVDANGLVTAVLAGNAVITVTTTDGGFTATCDVTVNVPVVSVTGVAVSPTTLTLDEGQTSSLAETVSPANATDQSVSWSSSNSSIATVDANGLVTAVLAGNAVITVTTTDGGFTATCDVTVNSITQITTLNPIADSYVRGSTYESNNYGTDVNLTVKNSSDLYTRRVYMKFDLAGISSSVSSAVLRLYLNNATGSSDHTVKLVSDDSWTETGITWLNEPSAGSVVASNNITTSDVDTYIDYDITSAVIAESGGLLSLQISADNTSFTSYDSREATNVPELVITPVFGQIAVTGVSVNPTSLDLFEGQTSSLAETVAPVDATDQTVSWSSSNASVATVDANGVVSALSAGQAIITVTTNDGGYTDNCSVTVTAVPQSRTLNVTASNDDQEIRSNGSSKWVGNTTHRVGGSGAGYDGAAVHPFQLPVLNAGETILDASFTVNLNTIGNTPSGNVDVYGLPYRASSTVSTSTDYWQGAYQGDPNATPIQNDFAVMSTPYGNVVTDATGNVNLIAYINAQYSAGAQGGDYVFIRLNPDVANVSDYEYWEFYAANSSNDPVLYLEIGASLGKSALKKSQEQYSSTFKVYPNPVKGDQFYVEFTENDITFDGAINVSIFDITGKQVLNTKISEKNTRGQLTISCEGQLKNGVYFVSIINKEHVSTEKIIISK